MKRFIMLLAILFSVVTTAQTITNYETIENPFIYLHFDTAHYDSIMQNDAVTAYKQRNDNGKRFGVYPEKNYRYFGNSKESRYSKIKNRYKQVSPEAYSKTLKTCKIKYATSWQYDRGGMCSGRITANYRTPEGNYKPLQRNLTRKTRHYNNTRKVYTSNNKVACLDRRNFPRSHYRRVTISSC